MGKRSRALQYPPVRTLCTLKPSARHCAAQLLTAFWHEPSVSNACRVNIDERHRRRVQPLPMLRQVRLRHAEQLWAGKQIEKADRIDPLRASANLLSVLLGMKRGITLSQGWPRGWFGGCVVTNIVPIPVNLPHTFQPLSLARSSPATARHASLLCA